MPIPMNINKDSSKHEVDAAISNCIRFLRREGRKGDQAVAICHSEARKKQVK